MLTAKQVLENKEALLMTWGESWNCKDADGGPTFTDIFLYATPAGCINLARAGIPEGAKFPSDEDLLDQFMVTHYAYAVKASTQRSEEPVLL